MFAIPFRIAHSRTEWDGWLLTTEEKNDLSEAWTPVLSYYLPIWMKEHFLLIYAGYVTGTIFVNKDLEYRDWKKKQPKEEEE